MILPSRFRNAVLIASLLAVTLWAQPPQPATNVHVNAPVLPGGPSNPTPLNNATGVPLNQAVSWTAGANTATMNIAFGSCPSPSVVVTGTVATSYSPPGLLNSTTYCWQITDVNSSGGAVSGPVWTFTTVAGGPTGVLTQADFTFLGYVRPQRTATNQNCNFEVERQMGFAARVVGGVVHFFINQGDTGASNDPYAPCEFADPSTYDASGNCTANCPNTTLTSAPFANLVTNWGLNDDGTTYPFYHGLLGQYYDNTNTLVNDCPFSNSLPAPGGGCIAYGSYAPSAAEAGGSNYYYTVANASYGVYHDKGGLTLCTMDSPNDGSGHRITTCHGPFIVQAPSGIGNYPSDGITLNGFWNAGYFVSMPDSSFGHGWAGSGASQQGGSPSGPNLSTSNTCTGCTNGWPGPTTPTTVNDRIASQKNYLHYYNMSGHGGIDPATCNYVSPAPIVAFRFGEAFPYVTEAVPQGIPTGCNQGALEAINPMSSPGNKGTWSETTGGNAMVWIQTATKRGVISFISGSTNHALGNTTSCNQAHVWYCAGSFNGNSGVPCAGAMGDLKSPQYQCPSVVLVTGPTTTATGQEARWVIYDPTTLTSVSNGTTIDYTVDPTSTIFPEVVWSLPYAPTTSLVRKATGGAWFNPATHILYVEHPFADTVTQFGEHRPVIAVFRIP